MARPTYKYLGVLQNSDVKHELVRQCVEKNTNKELDLFCHPG